MTIGGACHLGWASIRFAILLAALVTSVILATRHPPVLPSLTNFKWFLLTMFFGAIVGFSEINSHYADEPILAALTLPGLTYITLNAFLAGAGFLLLRAYPDAIFPRLKNDLLLSSIVAGFGSMAILRSKLFTFGVFSINRVRSSW